MQLKDPELGLASDTTRFRAIISCYQGLITFHLSALFFVMLASDSGSMWQKNDSSFRPYISQIGGSREKSECFSRSPRENLNGILLTDWSGTLPESITLPRRTDYTDWLRLGSCASSWVGDGVGCTGISRTKNRGQFGNPQDENWAWVLEESGWILNS